MKDDKTDCMSVQTHAINHLPHNAHIQFQFLEFSPNPDLELLTTSALLVSQARLPGISTAMVILADRMKKEAKIRENLKR